MTRPSHQLPRDMFDRVLDLETAAREAATFYAAHGQTKGVEYVQLCEKTGLIRDELAQMILDRISR